MSSAKLSRTSLEDVLLEIAKAEMPPARRHDMASAVRTVARAIGRKPRDIEADPKMLGIRLKSVSAIALGLSQGRWNNVRSLLRSARVAFLRRATRRWNELDSQRIAKGCVR